MSIQRVTFVHYNCDGVGCKAGADGPELKIPEGWHGVRVKAAQQGGEILWNALLCPACVLKLREMFSDVKPGDLPKGD